MNEVPAATTRNAASAQPTETSSNAIPLHQLPLVAMVFSEDPKIREEFATLSEEFGKISEALSVTQEGGRRIHRGLPVVKFKTVLENLGIPMPDGMTEAEAAAGFLQFMEKFAGRLAELRSALEQGPWDWGKWDGWGMSQSNERQERINRLLQHAGAAINGLMQARWRTGDTSESSSDWEMLRLLTLRAGDNTGAFGSLFEAGLQARAARTVGIGIAFDAWTDEQLARFPAVLAAHNALAVTRRGLEAELEYLEGFKQRPEEVRAFLGNRPMPPRGFNSFIRHLSSNVMGDQQIQDNLAVIAADFEFALAQLDVQNRLYVPPPTGQRSPAVEIVADQSSFSNYYFMPFKDLVAWNERHASFADGRPDSAVRSQASTDYARFAAALELERRSSGEYPDSLDAVSPAFPSGMPHDVATGQPYFYERTPEGSYRIWSTGIDQTNHNGDPKKDIVFTLPKVE